MKRYILLTAIVAAAMATLVSFAGKNPADKAALGKELFFDSILSKDRTISCASCHKPAFAFADTSVVSKGVDGQRGIRNTPSSMNLRLQQSFFWDGRAATLEEQALAPIENPREMALPLDEAVQRLKQSSKYRELFQTVFNSEPTKANVAQAIAAFERTLETSNSPFDEWKFLDKPEAVSEAAKRGFLLFSTKGKCTQCHFGADFTNNGFRNIGLFDGRRLNDSGRYAVSRQPADVGKFKVGSLRNVAVTAPYMHNGLFKTLRQVIEFYNNPAKAVPGAVNRDTALRNPLGLTAQEKKDLEAFLLSLTDKQFSAAAQGGPVVKKARQ